MRNWKKFLAWIFVLLLFPSGTLAAEQSAYIYKKSSIFKPNDHFDFQKYIREKSLKSRPRLTFQAGENPVKWQDSARAELRKLLAIPPSPYCPLQTQLGEVVPCKVTIGKQVHKYSRQEILFYSRPNFPVIGYLLLPEKNSANPVQNAAVICLPGHGSRVEDIVGLAPDGTNRVILSKEYQHDLAVQCVAAGYTTLAIELLGSGARQYPVARPQTPQGLSCRSMDAYAGTLGETVLGYRVFDVMRAVDYLRTRPDVDKERISTMGISAGGALSLFSAAADPRIKAAVVSCYFNEIEASLLTFTHCHCHYVENLAKTFRLSDIAGLIAPRLLILESSKQDQGFPLAGALSAYKGAKKIFTAFKVPQQVCLFQVEGNHIFDGREAFSRLNAAMSKRGAGR